MEQNEYRKQTSLASKRSWWTAVGAAECADLMTFDAVNNAVTYFDGPGFTGQVLAAASLAGGAGFYARLRQRRSEEFRRRQRRRASEGWATKQDLQNSLGEAAARKHGKITRPSLQAQTRGEQLRRMGTRSQQHATEFGVPLGTIRTGTCRGKPLVANWEQNVLMLGQPGTGKSKLLAGMIARTPGASIVISTKDEFVRGTARLRQLRRGPVRVWDLRGHAVSSDLCDHLAGDTRFRWNLVRGCGDPVVAQRRASALISTVDASGANAEMFQEKSQNLITGLLVAAARDGKGIDTIAKWVSKEKYEEPAKILGRFGDLPDQLLYTINEMTDSRSEKTAGSVSQTASTCFGFLSSSRELLQELVPVAEEETDLDQLIRDRGTLYVIADRKDVRPITAALLDDARTAASRVATARGKRLDPPMSVIADEVQTSLRGVPIDEWSAEMRSTGVWMCFALQDRSQLKEGWGADRAETIEATLHHTVLTGPPAEQWEHYVGRIGKRTETHMSVSENKPDTLWHRIMPNMLRHGHTSQRSTSRVDVPVLEAADLGQLGHLEALVLPSQGRPAIVSFPENWSALAEETRKAAAGSTSGEQREEPEEGSEEGTSTARPEAHDGPRLHVVPDDENGKEGAA